MIPTDLRNKMEVRASNHLCSQVLTDKITFFVAGYSLVWYLHLLKQLFTLVLVNSGGYFPINGSEFVGCCNLNFGALFPLIILQRKPTV